MPDLEHKIATALEKLAQVQRTLLWDVAKEENLSPIQIQFIIYLGTHSENWRKVSILAEEFDLTKATVSDAIKNLEEKKLLKKIKVKTDKRSFVLQLTARGSKLYEKISNWQQSLLDNIASLPEKEKIVVLDFLTQLIKNLYAQGVVSLARMCITCENFRKGASGKYECGLTGRLFKKEEINMHCDHYAIPADEPN